jgi:hypothetical protein
VDLRSSQVLFVEEVLHTLSVASVLSGRRIAFPLVPCDSAWLKRDPPHANPIIPAAEEEERFGTCRTGLCEDWRLYSVGHASEAEAEAEGRRRGGGEVEAELLRGFHRTVPHTQECTAVVASVRSPSVWVWKAATSKSRPT